MNKHQGFSLIEVLLSLILVAMTAITLLQQQWQSSQYYNQIHLQTQALFELDNLSESWLAGQKLRFKHQIFNLQSASSERIIELHLSWQDNNIHHIRRSLNEIAL